jgi:3-oxoacyl-(acyl-carrier-protein) synthase/NADPH:quinone reductase-like Zn-dependent oxidoreductase/aryl carrier-like protein
MKVLESSPPVQSVENLWKYELKDGQRGSLDQFQLVPDKIPLHKYLENIVPPEGYALIEVCYIGLNFRDVLNVLGMYPGNPGPPGCEFSGKIIRLNKLNQQPDLQEEEFVIGFHTGCFQPFITVPISQIIRLPRTIPLEVGCMLPIIYTTIEFCFQKALSQLHPGDIILIHSGSGGIGLVAIQYAKYYQLTILTTVNKNNKEKYSFLRDEMGIPEEQIFHSRNAEEFHRELSQYFRQDQSKNRSISMVINSLTDDFIPYSMEFLGHLAPGYFMELGKRDRWTTETIRKRFPTQSIRYIPVEIDELALQSSSSSYKELLSTVIGRFDERQFTNPIHFQVFDYFLEVKEAFLQLKNGQTIGKSVIKLSSPRLIKNLRAFQANGGNYPPTCFVITGGTGSLGVLVTHSLLAREDVEKVFLLSRSGEFKSDVHNLASQLPTDKIEIVRVDVSDETAMNAFFSTYFTADMIEKPKYHLRGIFHCAGIVKDSLLPQVSSSASTSHVVSYLQNFHEIWRSKCESARILFEVSQKIHSDATKSPFLVLFSSIVARIGRVGQASYAIANRFLDGMAMENNSVYSIRWPAILDIGMAAQQNGNHVNTNHWHIRSEDVSYFLESLSNEINSPTSSSFSQSRVRNIFPSSIGRILDEQIRNQFPAVIHLIENDQTAKRKKIQMGKKTKGKKRQGNDSWSSLPASFHPVPDKESLRQLVMQLCNDFFPTEILSSLTEASNLIENGLDSLAATEFVHHLTQSVFSVFGSEIKLPGTFLFNYSTIHEVIEKLHEILAPNRDPTIDSAGPTNPANGSKQHDNGSADGVEKEEIAIIAASCAFPGNIFSLDDLHRVQSNGVVVTNHFPSEERMKSYQSTLSSAASFFHSNKKDSLQQTIQFGGFLSDEYLKDFSYKWFDNLPLLEANKLDLRQKLALKITRQCFQESHLEVNDWKGKRVGVYVACLGQLKSSSLSSSQSTGQAKYSVFDATSNSMSVLSGRISFTFGLEGPCMTIDTACSSSLVAIHMARNALQSKECEFAVVVSINLIDLELSIPFGLSGMLSSDGKCHSFDDAANGYVRSEGCAAILLAPLSMASNYAAPPLAIIRASIISHDGKSASLTSPNGLAQEKLLRQTIEQAGLQPDDIDAIEAHGTGTRLGDPIEVEAILKVFQDRTNTQKPLYLSSVKGNLGHLEASAGMAGIFAAINCLKHQKVFPNANLSSINREIDQLLEAHKAKEWLEFPRDVVDLTSTESCRFVGISSFGYSGTIAHCILQSGKVGQEIAKIHA